MILSCLRNSILTVSYNKEKETLAWRQQFDWFRRQYIGLYRKMSALKALRLYTFVRGFWINRGVNISGGKSASEQAIALLIKNAFCFYSFSMKHNKSNSLKYKLEVHCILYYRMNYLSVEEYTFFYLRI